MQNTSTDKIKEIAIAQRKFFRSGATTDTGFRKRMLARLLEALEAWEERLALALWQDMHKSYEEAYLTEFSILKGEIKVHLKELHKWARRERIHTPATLFPSRSYTVKEPLGCSLIISPWNYPVQLLINPLIGAISAGCTAVLKPSPYVPAVSSTIADMIAETFNEEYVAVVQGNRDVNTALLDERWDMIFFTGSPSLGRTVMAAAAKNLTPVVLELGGKSPCIIDSTADVEIAARRIAWGKTLNSGQTCIAPDYLIVHEEVKEPFIQAFAKEVKALHGEDISGSRHYVHMVNQKSYDRVCSYLTQGKILYGGKADPETRCIEPTLLECTDMDAPVMQEEIFGPIFPIITFNGTSSATTARGENNRPSYSGGAGDDTAAAGGLSFAQQAISFISEREKPLALYFFGDENTGWEIIRKTSSGGGCINDVIMHIANGNMPFGGVGNSGMGRYHHRYSFECFTHTRSILVSAAHPDFPFRYMPYRFFKWVKRLM